MVSIDPARLIVPAELADGRVVWGAHEADLSDRLCNGDPTLGWEGDPALKLVRNVVEERWEVWRTAPTGEDTLICTRAGARFPGNDLIVALVKADSRRHDRARQIMADQAARDERRRKDYDDASEDRADRLAFALGRDLGMPAQHGRTYKLGSD